MKRQQGQSAVEFALMAPIIFMMIFGMIYGGFMFMEYLHYSNAVRTAAREIAVSNNKADTITAKKEWLEDLWKKEISIRFYEPTVTISEVANDSGKKDVVVKVEFTMEDAAYKSLPNILKSTEDISYGIGFPPKTIRTLKYTMQEENSSGTS